MHPHVVPLKFTLFEVARGAKRQRRNSTAVIYVLPNMSMFEAQENPRNYQMAKHQKPIHLSGLMVKIWVDIVKLHHGSIHVKDNIKNRLQNKESRRTLRPQFPP